MSSSLPKVAQSARNRRHDFRLAFQELAGLTRRGAESINNFLKLI